MRITNGMMTNNILQNINRNKATLSKLGEQLSTGKKIQRPSDNPIIAVRALKLRTNVREIEQYQTNARDASSWMSVSEQAMYNIEDIIKRIHELAIQGSSDTLTINDRRIIKTEITQLKEQLLNEGNVNYAGRHVFTGFKTDTPLVYTKDSADQFEITEHFTPSNVNTITKIIDGTPPRQVEVSRIRLAYSTTIPATPPATITGFTVNIMNSTDLNAYEPTTTNINFLQDTGELIINTSDISTLPANITFSYDKAGFKKTDINPMNYFDSVHKVDTLDNTTWITYSEPVDKINYQVSYNQDIAVNTLGKDFITKDLVRDLEELINAIDNIPNDGSVKQALLEDALGDMFEKAITKVSSHLDTVLEKHAELGSKMNRLELTLNRLEDDNINFTDLLSANEDIDITEVIVKMQSQEMVYNAALMSSSKIIQHSLLDFIR